MAKYRKKPIVIDATQWLGWKEGPHNLGILKPSRPGVSPSEGWIDTSEGGHIVTPGDWIVAGIKSERYPCKPDIFEATYELVDTK